MLTGTNKNGTFVISKSNKDLGDKPRAIWDKNGYWVTQENDSQPIRMFFGPAYGLGKNYPAPSFEQKEQMLNVNSPLAEFIGNNIAVDKLKRVIFSAYDHPLHLCRELFFAFLGPSSTGKTTLARLYAKCLKLPFVEISPKACPTVQDLFLQIKESIESQGLMLKENPRCLRDIKPDYFLPPCVILIDEVHALSNGVVQGLLKATEYNDSTLVTEKGTRIDCSRVSWNVATTDIGQLFDAFRIRFVPVELTYLTQKEISQVVKNNNPELANEQNVCDLVAHYCPRVPRTALAFAREMKLEKRMKPKTPWEEVAKTIAKGNNIDEFGMHNKHVQILKILSNGSVSSKRLADKVGVKLEELERIWVPFLQIESEDFPSLITTTSKGYDLTSAGIKELAKRGIVVKNEE
jgi:Holliday junction resolvasome RuvABC ATP-dependent DNA helicase subunit